MNQKVDMTISTSVWSAQHPNAGRNIQHAKFASKFTEGSTKRMGEVQSENRGEVECTVVLKMNELI